MALLAPPAPPFALRGKTLPSSPRPIRPPGSAQLPSRRNLERDIVSTIIGTYGDDPGIQLSPLEPRPYHDKPLPSKPFEVSAADDPAVQTVDSGRQRRDELESSSGPGQWDVSGGFEMDDDYDPFRQTTPLGSNEAKTERETLLGRWRNDSSTQITRKPIAEREKKEAEIGQRKRVDSAMSQGTMKPEQTPTALMPATRNDGLPLEEGPASKIGRAFSRSTKPTSLKLHKSNGSTAESLSSVDSSDANEPSQRPKQTSSVGQLPSQRARGDLNALLPPLPPKHEARKLYNKDLPASATQSASYLAKASTPAPAPAPVSRSASQHRKLSSGSVANVQKPLPSLNSFASQLREDRSRIAAYPNSASQIPQSNEMNKFKQMFRKEKEASAASPENKRQHLRDSTSSQSSNYGEDFAGGNLSSPEANGNLPPTPPTLPTTPTDLPAISFNNSKEQFELSREDSEATITQANVPKTTATTNAGHGFEQDPNETNVQIGRQNTENEQYHQRTVSTLPHQETETYANPTVADSFDMSHQPAAEQSTATPDLTLGLPAIPDITSLVRPSSQNDRIAVPVKPYQLRCHGAHRGFHGPFRNVGRAACQLCCFLDPSPAPGTFGLELREALRPLYWQCGICAIWVCDGCHKDVLNEVQRWKAAVQAAQRRAGPALDVRAVNAGVGGDA